MKYRRKLYYVGFRNSTEVKPPYTLGKFRSSSKCRTKSEQPLTIQRNYVCRRYWYIQARGETLSSSRQGSATKLFHGGYWSPKAVSKCSLCWEEDWKNMHNTRFSGFFTAIPMALPLPSSLLHKKMYTGDVATKIK